MEQNEGAGEGGEVRVVSRGNGGKWVLAMSVVAAVFVGLLLTSCSATESVDSTGGGAAAGSDADGFCDRLVDFGDQIARLQADRTANYDELSRDPSAAQAADATMLSLVRSSYQDLARIAPDEIREDIEYFGDLTANAESIDVIYSDPSAQAPAERLDAWQGVNCRPSGVATDEAGCRLEDVPTAGNRVGYFFGSVHEGRNSTTSNPVDDPFACAYRQLCLALRAEVSEAEFRDSRGEALSPLLSSDSYSGARAGADYPEVGLDQQHGDMDTLDPDVSSTWSDANFTWSVDTGTTELPRVERWRIDLEREEGAWRVCGFVQRGESWGA